VGRAAAGVAAGIVANDAFQAAACARAGSGAWRAGAALVQHDDPASVAVLQLAHREAVARGEVWWLAETLRVRAQAERRFGDTALASELLVEARRVATEHGAQLLVDRLAAHSD
jgi:hypothetical protein